MGIRGWGRTLAEAFEEIASAMFELMVSGEGLDPSRQIAVSREGADLTELLVEFLNVLLSDADVSGTALLRVSVGTLEKRGETWAIEAVAGGVPVAEAHERLLVEVKAATYYGAAVTEHGPGKWEARCVVDL